MDPVYTYSYFSSSRKRGHGGEYSLRNCADNSVIYTDRPTSFYSFDKHLLNYKDMFLLSDEAKRNIEGNFGMATLRFIPFYEVTVSRDMDEKETWEKYVDDFIKSEAAVHVIRISPSQTFHPLVGGQVAFKRDKVLSLMGLEGIEDYVNLLNNYLSDENYKRHEYRREKLYYGLDERWLQDVVWPHVKGSLMVHSVCPTKWDESDQIIIEI